MGKGIPPSPSSDIEEGMNNYKSHHRTRPRPPPQFSPPAPEPWFAWLMPLVFVANIVMFVVTMYVNDCPATTGPEKCLFYDNLGSFLFQSVDTVFCPGLKSKFSSIESCFGSGIHFSV